MAGKKQFDENKALRGLVAAFTKLGFHGASLSTLEAETGLSRSSLYNGFGGKTALFTSALKSYVAEVELRHLACLDRDDVVAAFSDLFRSQLQDLAAKGSAGGCLTTCAMGEMPYADQDVRSAVYDTVRLVKQRIGQRLNEARKAGALREVPDIDELRDFLFGATRAIPLLHRSDPTGTASRHFAECAVNVVQMAAQPTSR